MLQILSGFIQHSSDLCRLTLLSNISLSHESKSFIQKNFDYPGSIETKENILENHLCPSCEDAYRKYREKKDKDPKGNLLTRLSFKNEELKSLIRNSMNSADPSYDM